LPTAAAIAAARAVIEARLKSISSFYQLDGGESPMR